MKLSKALQEFRNSAVFYPDPKNIDLDRVLLRLFLLLKCDGYLPASRGSVGAAFERVDTHLDNLGRLQGVEGFTDESRRKLILRWLETDIFDLVNRDKASEAISSLRPLHLDAHKIRVNKHCRDYNHADALYAMLEFGERQALVDLKSYLTRGLDPHSQKYDGTPLDLETLAVLKLVEGLPEARQSGDKVTPHAPLCIGQSRVLCDDIHRVLAYRDVVPRPVMIDYLKSILGLHLGLFTVRLGRLLSGWLADRGPHPVCMSCPVHGGLDRPFEACPYPVTALVDMGTDPRSHMARRSQDDAAETYARLLDLVRGVFATNQIRRWARNSSKGELRPAEAVMKLTDPAELDIWAKYELGTIREALAKDREASVPELDAIEAAGLSPFETLIEVIIHARQKHHVSYLVQMMDKLLQKNGVFGVLVQGRSKANPRRWHLGSRTLELLAQLAVVKPVGTGAARSFRTEPMLIDDFARFISDRYGFAVAADPRKATTTPEEQRAFRDNVRALRVRLRDIGFFEDLSDAYNAQMLRPRYVLGEAGGS